MPIIHIFYHLNPLHPDQYATFIHCWSGSRTGLKDCERSAHATMLGHMPSLAYMQQFVRSRSLRDTATPTTTCTAAVSEWAKEDVRCSWQVACSGADDARAAGLARGRALQVSRAATQAHVRHLLAPLCATPLCFLLLLQRALAHPAAPVHICMQPPFPHIAAPV